MGCKSSIPSKSTEKISTVTLNQDLSQQQIRWLPRNLKKGEQLKISNTHSYGLSPNSNSINVTLINEKCHWFEIEKKYLTFN